MLIKQQLIIQGEFILKNSNIDLSSPNTNLDGIFLDKLSMIVRKRAKIIDTCKNTMVVIKKRICGVTIDSYNIPYLRILCRSNRLLQTISQKKKMHEYKEEKVRTLLKKIWPAERAMYNKMQAYVMISSFFIRSAIVF